MSRASQLSCVSATTLQADLPLVVGASSVLIFLGLVGSLVAFGPALLCAGLVRPVRAHRTAAGLANGTARVRRRRPATLMGYPTS